MRLESALNELLSLSEKANRLAQRLREENGHVNVSFEKCQQHFSDQAEGKLLAGNLSQVMQEITNAAHELERLKSVITDDCTRSLTK